MTPREIEAAWPNTTALLMEPAITVAALERGAKFVETVGFDPIRFGTHPELAEDHPC